MNEKIQALFMVLLGAAACGATDEGSYVDQVDEGALWAERETKWPAGPNGRTTISVCWETRGFESKKELTRAAVVGSWGAAAKIDFVGWDDCGRRTDVDLRVRIADEQPQVAADDRDEALFGRRLRYVRGGITLNFTFRRSFRCSADDLDTCIRGYSIHEFGHALGFVHEQDRADAPRRCPDGDDLRTGTEPETGLVLGPYDPDSIMNYCARDLFFADPKLSAGDIRGVRRWYGTPQRTPANR